MRVYAHYDINGKIRALITTNGPEGKSVMLAPRAGEAVSQVDDVKPESLKLYPTAADVKSLREILTSHKVELQPRRTSNKE
jgi:hypothetical protein